MSKIKTSKYSLFKNLEADIFGRFLFKMKRRTVTRNLLSFSKVLSRVKPVKLSDLLIRRKRKSKVSSTDTLINRKLMFYYGRYRSFFSHANHLKSSERSPNTIAKTKISAPRKTFSRIIELWCARLEVILSSLNLFSFIREARKFISKEGVLVNNVLIKNPSFVLSPGDIISFTPFNKVVLQRKLYRVLRARPSITTLREPINKELNSVLTLYSWLYRRQTNKSPFLVLGGFPRYIEPNFTTMEFYYYGSIKPEDVTFPFKTTLAERSRFFSSML